MNIQQAYLAQTALVRTAVSNDLYSRELHEDAATAIETQLDAELEDALIPILFTLYMLSIANGDLPPDGLNKADMRAWVADQYTGDDVEELGQTLNDFAVANWETGMYLALIELGFPASSAQLTDSEILAQIQGRADHNITDNEDGGIFSTTIDEVTNFMIGAGAGLILADLIPALGEYATNRSLLRGRSIAVTEDTLWINQGVTTTYKRNGIKEAIWLTRPELSASGVCPICEPLHGQIFTIIEGIFSFVSTDGLTGLIGTDMPPLHPECKCIVQPVTDGIIILEIWSGAGG